MDEKGFVKVPLNFEKWQKTMGIPLINAIDMAPLKIGADINENLAREQPLVVDLSISVWWLI